MELSDFDFDLPAAQIAQYPAVDRDQSRLMVLDRASGRCEHRRFADLCGFLRPEDVLVLNRTRVFRARLEGRRLPAGGHVELLLTRPDGDSWIAMGRPARRLKRGTDLDLAGGLLQATVVDRTERGRVRVRFAQPDVNAVLEHAGHVPLPPYIQRPDEPLDAERYQTVYAEESGAVAAPTAGLHFTPNLLERLAGKGVGVCTVLLHVGPGTFEPVRTEDPRDHELEPEFCEVDAQAAAAICRRREAGGRTCAVGTTVVRTLETAAEASGAVEAWSGWSGKFIYPPYTFRAVDALVTNFHLPRSTLLMLVAAFAGRERILAAYREAVAQRYRFYSYGDAMLIL